VPVPQSLLASDLDGTLIPPPTVADDGGIAALRGALEEHGTRLAYVTGRHLKLALEGLEAHGLPMPELLVCDVGTSVYVRAGESYELDAGYRALMSEATGGVELASLGPSLETFSGLRLQEPEKQAAFKLSFYAPGGEEGEALSRRVAERLERSEASVNVVHSVDAVKDVGLIDVLPAGVAKDTAVRYVHDRSGLPEDRLAYAGDSGNDRAAMLSGFNVVVVGNAADPFKRSIRREADERGLGDRVYLAEACYAAGVLEGCRHYGLL
jgi:HAD superfamily hydrolase (TIGR01484 family)